MSGIILTMDYRPALTLLWKATRGAAACLLAVALFALGFYAWLHSDGNVCEVLPGRLYRAAQPSELGLADLSRKHGIKTIVNLRGEHPGEPWYDREKAFAERNGLRLVSLSLSAGRVLSVEEMRGLEKVFASSAGPVLVHCKSGSDRTGLACAIYLLLDGASWAAADGQLSLRFGHFPYLWSVSQAMDDSFAHYGRLRGLSGERRPGDGLVGALAGE